MQRISRSDGYSLGALVALGILLLVDEPVVMLIVSVVGLGLGLWLGARDELRRAGMVAGVAFAVAIAMAVLAIAR